MLSDVFFPRVNGVSTSIETYRADLQALGHECALVAPKYSPPQFDHLRHTESLDTIRIPAWQVPFDPEDRLLKWRSLMAWANTLKPADVDVVHIQTPFTAHYAGVRIARRLGVPVVATYHTYFEHYLHHYVPALPISWTRFVARRFTLSQCHQVQAVVSPSTQMAEALCAYGVRTPIEVLPTGLPPSCFVPGNGARFRAAKGITAQRPVALFVGRVAHEKNIDFLVKMLVQLKARIPDILLVIAGEGPAEAHIRALVSTLNLQGNVLFVGYMKRNSELLDCYRAADVFVFASRTETQGLVLLEALAQGTPVISTAVMGTAAVLAGVKGAVVVPEAVIPFAEAVASLLRDSERRLDLASFALEDAARWSSRNFAERLVRLYESLVEADLAPVEAFKA